MSMQMVREAIEGQKLTIEDTKENLCSILSSIDSDIKNDNFTSAIIQINSLIEGLVKAKTSQTFINGIKFAVTVKRV